MIYILGTLDFCYCFEAFRIFSVIKKESYSCQQKEAKKNPRDEGQSHQEELEIGPHRAHTL